MALGRSIRRDFTTMSVVLIPVAIAINIAVGQIVHLLQLPIFLDSIGTVLVGVLCGPWAGALTGGLSNVIWGLTIDPSSLPWFPVAMFIGFMAGWCGTWGLFRVWWKVFLAGLAITAVSIVVSSIVNVTVFQGIAPYGSSLITGFFLQAGRSVWESVIATNAIVEPIDKILTSFLAFAIARGLSARYIARFPRAENVLGTGN